nr:hypothetical protein [Nostoc sp. ZfuVER08]
MPTQVCFSIATVNCSLLMVHSQKQRCRVRPTPVHSQRPCTVVYFLAIAPWAALRAQQK